MQGKVTILIVDDSDEKMRQVRDAIAVVGEIALIHEARTVHEAIQRLRTTAFDLLVLDMYLPLRANEEPRPDGGARIIETLKVDSGLVVPLHIVGLTEYDDLRERFSDDLARDLWFLVKYERNSTDWETRLRSHINHIVEGKRHRGEGQFASTLAMVTALHSETVLEVWPELRVHREPGDDTIYHSGSVRVDGYDHTIVAASAPQMGMAASTALAMKVITAFRPRYLCMTGIAAGAKGNFGDILVATQSWDYGSGKQTKLLNGKGVFSPAPERIPLDNAIKNQLEWFQLRNKTFGNDILTEWRKTERDYEPPQAPKLQLGPMASGAAVVADRGVINRLLKLEERKLVGIEMEAYGVVLASKHCAEPRPSALVAKSICDFADPEKDDRYQRYAAFTSASFIRHLFQGRGFGPLT